jgi:hypothetical protein
MSTNGQSNGGGFNRFNGHENSPNGHEKPPNVVNVEEFIDNGHEEEEEEEEEEEILAQSEDLDDFDLIIGCIEDIFIEKQFQDLQESFLEGNYHHFEIGTEENKLIYTEIFQVHFLLIFILKQQI